MLSLDELRKKAGDEGTIDTIVTAFTDMQGRLFGKRIEIEYFLDEVTGHGVEGCNYLLALDMDMEPLPGYEMANWEDGYGDFGIQPDMSTLRRIPWLDRTALVLADVVNDDGVPGRRLAAPDPDRRLRARQRDGLHAVCGLRARVLPLQGELRRGLGEGLQGPHPDDPLHPRLPHPRHHDGRGRTSGRSAAGCTGAGIPVEFSKGEAWYGQHEVNFRYADAVTSADRHTIYKNGVKEIAFLNDISATFMAKPSENDIGSSCHIHQSLVGEDGKSVFVDGDGEETDTFMHFLGGMRNHIRELALFVAPSINSYKRYAAESWAPTSVSWGRDNRTCGFRDRRPRPVAAGRVPDPRRRRQPVPRPSPRCWPPGLDGIENETDPGPELKGNAYEAGRGRGRSRHRCARRSTSGRRATSPSRRSATPVHKHYLNYGRSSRACSTRSSPTTSGAACSSAARLPLPRRGRPRPAW